MSEALDVMRSRSKTVSFEWVFQGVGPLIAESEGPILSKPIKSPLFGGLRWMLLFYVNGGGPTDSVSTDDSEYVSIFLVAEPTESEKNAGGDRWTRDGTYVFNFAIDSIDRTKRIQSSESEKRNFSHKMPKWGWIRYCKRKDVQDIAPGIDDKVIITCTVSSEAEYVPQARPDALEAIPRELIATVGNLINNPTHSDVVFVVSKSKKKIYVIKAFVERFEYFKKLLEKGVQECDFYKSPQIEEPEPSEDEEANANGSDNEDDAETVPTIAAALGEEVTGDKADECNEEVKKDSNENVTEESKEEDSKEVRPDSVGEDTERLKISSEPEVVQTQTGDQTDSSKSTKLAVAVRDVKFSTFLAIVVYAYTGVIIFAPLESTFAPPENNSIATTPREPRKKARLAWITKWKENNPGCPTPCSAKTIYEFATKHNFEDLKVRALKHVSRSATPANIPYELFSSFTSAHAEVKEEQMQYFLSHWEDIRSSEAMLNVWTEIKDGHHPGFIKVWPALAARLQA